MDATVFCYPMDSRRSTPGTRRLTFDVDGPIIKAFNTGNEFSSISEAKFFIYVCRVQSIMLRYQSPAYEFCSDAVVVSLGRSWRLANLSIT